MLLDIAFGTRRVARMQTAQRRLMAVCTSYHIPITMCDYLVICEERTGFKIGAGLKIGGQVNGDSQQAHRLPSFVFGWEPPGFMAKSLAFAATLAAPAATPAVASAAHSFALAATLAAPAAASAAAPAVASAADLRALRARRTNASCFHTRMTTAAK
jgi:hypothetical protein